MFLILFVLNWSIGRNSNWSETDVTLFPEIAFSDMFVEKISIRVLECEVIRVGDVNWGTKDVQYNWCRKSAVLWSFSYFSKSVLKSPNKTISLFFSDNIPAFPFRFKQIFFNWDSLHARLNSHYEAWSYKKKKHKKRLQHIQEICLERTYRCLLILDLKLLRS